MPVTYQRTVTAYAFDELSESAKERARDWWREGVDMSETGDFDYADEVAAILGIEIARRSIPLMNGETRTEPVIYWSGFSSQGDGACFAGHYAYRAGWRAALAEHIGKPTDDNRTLYDIGNALQAAQRPHFYNLEASIKHRGHYYHSGCTDIDVNNRDYPCSPLEGSDVDDISDALRSFMDWIYSNLEADYWHQLSAESVDENIQANGYEFNSDGTLFN